MKVPRRLKELNQQLPTAQRELTATLHRAPTPSELAEHLEVPREEIVEALIAGHAYRANSIDVPMSGDDDGVTVADRIGADDTGAHVDHDARTTGLTASKAAGCTA